MLYLAHSQLFLKLEIDGVVLISLHEILRRDNCDIYALKLLHYRLVQVVVGR